MLTLKETMEIKFKRDTSFRKQFFVPDSFAHPAKMDAQLLIWIVEHYTEEGETISDPMAGIGTTMLACTLGRNCILVELEEKFCKMMRDNWEMVKMRPQLGSSMGSCKIIRGDARDLYPLMPYHYGSEIKEGLFKPKWNYQVDKIVTSPPYVGVLATEDAEAYRKRRLKTKPNPKTGTHPFKASVESAERVGADYGKNPNNIGNLPYGQIDKIVTSPPYEGSLSSIDDEDRAKEFDRMKARGMKFNPLSYSNVTRGTEYSDSPSNIGNLKSQSYLEAMLQVYQQCYKVLRDDGLLILVTKNFIRNKQVIRLDLALLKGTIENYPVKVFGEFSIIRDSQM